MSKLFYCIRYSPVTSDPFTIDDLVKPSDADWNAALGDGLTLATSPPVFKSESEVRRCTCIGFTDWTINNCSILF